MARKNQWQQFADNFNSVYGTLNSFGKDMDASRIMNEEVEEVQNGLGPGPRSQYIAKYDGKTYNEQITPEMLKGLRNQRLIDSMAKFGDSEGAMKMQLDQATLRNQDNQANLAEATLADRIKGQGLQNDALLASIGLTKQQIEESKTLLPLKRDEYIQKIIADKSTNRVSVATEGSQISQAASDAGLSKSAAEISAMEAEEMKDTAYLRKNSVRTGYLADIAKNKALAVGSKVALSENNQKLAVNDMMEDFAKRAKNNEFADAKAGQDWMVKQMGDINPTLALDLKDNYNAHELSALTHSSTMFKSSAMDAYTKGGVEGLSDAIDKLNGVDNTAIEYNDKNDDVTIWAVDDSDPPKRLRKIVSGTPGANGTFEMNLQQVLDPAASMEISKAYHDDLKAQADILYVEAETEYKKSLGLKADAEAKAAGNTKVEFKKDDFFIRLLLEDPNNQLAWQGLVGENLSQEEIQIKLREETLRTAEPESPSADGVERDRDGVVVPTGDGGDTTSSTSSAVSGSLQDQITQLTTKVNSFRPDSPVSISAKQELEKLTSVEGLTTSIAALEKEIADHPRNKKGEFTFGKLGPAGAGSKKKAMDAKVTLLADMKASLKTMSKGLGG